MKFKMRNSGNEWFPGANFAKLFWTKFTHSSLTVNGTARFKNVNNCMNTNISFFFETSGGQSYKLYLNVVHFFNTSIN
jgi:hypothetical protein